MTLFIIVLVREGKSSVYKGRQTYLTVKKIGKLPEILKLIKTKVVIF